MSKGCAFGILSLRIKDESSWIHGEQHSLPVVTETTPDQMGGCLTTAELTISSQTWKRSNARLSFILYLVIRQENWSWKPSSENCFSYNKNPVHSLNSYTITHPLKAGHLTDPVCSCQLQFHDISREHDTTKFIKLKVKWCFKTCHKMTPRQNQWPLSSSEFYVECVSES